MTDDGFLDRRARKRLRIKLAAVPRLTEDVLDVMCRQSGRTQSNLGLSRPRKRDGQLPLHLGAADAFTKLRNSLILAVRHTCEDRGLDFMPVGYTHTQGFIGPLNDGERRIPYGYDEGAPIVTAKWLWRNIIAFGMTEGSSEFAEDILNAIDQCANEIDPDYEVVITPTRLKAANKQVVTASTIETVAKQIGKHGAGLNARRLRTLAAKADLKPSAVDEDTGTRFYRLGDVLAAHQRLPRRERADHQKPA